MIFTTAVFLGSLAGLLALGLVIAKFVLRVPENPQLEKVADLLPQANCGACGFPGCRAFAEALVAGQANPAQCTVSDDRNRQIIAKTLGVSLAHLQRNVARLACAGGANVARNRAFYQGEGRCEWAAQAAGGGKACRWGCLGLGDCVEVCQFDAIHLDDQGLPWVDEAKCTACGDCVRICPKELFSLHSVSQRLWVACKNAEAGDGLRDDCEVACTACGRCAADAPEQIKMVNNLPQIAAAPAAKQPIERCPTGAIVWIADNGDYLKGREAIKIVRQEKIMPRSS